MILDLNGMFEYLSSPHCTSHKFLSCMLLSRIKTFMFFVLEGIFCYDRDLQAAMKHPPLS